MKVYMKNIGVIEQAEFELGKLTIICGKNNTGKTYATYSLYGFIDYWYSEFPIDIGKKYINDLLSDGTTKINLRQIINNINTYTKKASESYSRVIHRAFASSEKKFLNSSFSFEALENIDLESITFKHKFRTNTTELFNIIKEKDSNELIVSLVVDKDALKIPYGIVSEFIGKTIKDLILKFLIPRATIISVERTGVAIFRKELNFARNRLLEELSLSSNEIDPFDIITKSYSDYAIAIRDNVDFTRKLELLSHNDSYIFKEYKYIIEYLSHIVDGNYKIAKNDDLFFIPNRKKIKLTMNEGASAIRSLLDLFFYICHAAQKGDLLIIDEPEMNLHPENQRKVARLIAMLVNAGIRVLITTHSDYIIKEINILIMLYKNDEKCMDIKKKFLYTDEQLINYNDVKLYIAKKERRLLEGSSRRKVINTLVNSPISESGMIVTTFDDIIDEMNIIQDELLWG